MNTFFSLILFVILGFGSMVLLFKPQIDKYSKTLELNITMLPAPYMLGIYALGCIGAYCFFDRNDFIEALTWYRMIIPLIFSVLIYFVSSIGSNLWQSVTVILCIAVTVALQPLGDGAAYPEIHPLILQLIMIAFFSIYCLGARVMNLLPHTFMVPNILLLLSLSVMAFLGATPLYLALCAALLAGIMSGYLSLNFLAVKIDFDDASATSIAYLISALLLMNLGEFCFPSCLILTSVFWAELFIAFWNKYFGSNGGSLSENTNYYIAAQKYSVQVLVLNICKISVITLFLSWFQLFAENQYSLPLISLALALWLNSNIGQSLGRKPLSEINKEFVQELKQNINDAKKLLDRDSEKK